MELLSICTTCSLCCNIYGRNSTFIH